MENEDIKKETSITKEFLEKILNRKITKFKASDGSNPGDNFTSILISLEIQFADKEEPEHLLYKTFPCHPTRQKLLEDTNVFLKEFLIYDSWIPELMALQKEIGNKEILKPALPELVAGAAIDYENVEVSPNDDPMLSNFLLMVDVRKTYGFKMADKLHGLGYHHVKAVLEELAKYHALCYAFKVHHDLPNVRSSFIYMEDPFFGNPNQEPTIQAIFEANFQLIKDVLGDFLQQNPEIAKAFDRFECLRPTKLLQKFLHPEGMDEQEVESLLRVKPETFTKPPLKDQWILAGHGDCWTNNMLFKTNEETGKVTDTMLVDLQVARESCIMADLAYFVYTSTDTAFRAKFLDEMLSLYREKFISYCKILKVEPFREFTLENFKRKFHRSKPFGFLFASLVVPIILQKPETALDLDTVKLEETHDLNRDDLAAMFQHDSRDEDDKNLLRDRFKYMLMELYEEGVL